MARLDWDDLRFLLALSRQRTLTAAAATLHATAGLRLLSPPEPPPERRLWLGVHRDVRQTPRVRAVVGFLVELLTRLRPALAGAR
jgi:DNA-binding transcriptional LysR family regulator